MMTNLPLLLEISLQWGIWLALYYLLLRQHTFFAWNRFYLLSTFVIGLVLPFIHFYYPALQEAGFILTLPEITINENPTSVFKKHSPINWFSVYYTVGVIVFTLNFLFNIGKLVLMLTQNKKQKHGTYWIVDLPNSSAPFSFFNFIFVFRKEGYSVEDWNQILLHEQTHGRLFHSLDILLIEILRIVFWFNPLVYLYKIALRDVHEFQADNTTIQRHNKKEYSRLLFRHTQSGMQVPLTSNFISSQLKKRIKMLTNKRSNPTALYRYLFALPLVVLLFFVSCRKEPKESFEKTRKSPDELKENAINKTNTPVKGDIFRAVDQMPIFEGCPQTPGNTKLDKCSERALLNYIYSKIKYPVSSRKAGTEGRCIAQFIVNKEGKIEGIKNLQSADEATGKEVIRVLNTMNDQVTWTPGKDHGQTVKVQYILPVMFKLD